MKITILGVVFAVSLLIMLVSAFKICSVNGVGAVIYIRLDGSVDPSSAPIQRNGNFYTFTSDIYNYSLEIQKDNITLDGNEHRLQGFTGSPVYNNFGIYLYSRTKVTITNLVISSFQNGIWLESSPSNRIINNTIFNIKDYGIRVSRSHYVTLTNNVVNQTYQAIALEYSNHNLLYDNQVSKNSASIDLYQGTNNTLRNNIMIANDVGFSVGYYLLESYLNDVDTSNTVDGKPIYYWINRHDQMVPKDAGGVVIVNSSRMTLKNLEIKNNWRGVALAFTKDSLIENVTGSGGGVLLDHCDSNAVTRNNVKNVVGPGIYLDSSTYNHITNNFVLNTSSSGIWLEDTRYNKVIGNTVVGSCGGTWQEFDGAGVLVDDSYGCEIIGNNLTRNWYGIVVGATPARYNLIINNNIQMNNIGLILFDANDNTVYHNNFIRNSEQIRTYFQMRLSFNDAYPSGGNYWSDYNSTDLYCGASQNILGSDGIGDTPYTIDQYNRDNYPLRKPYPWSSHDIGITNINLSRNTAGQGFVFRINVTLFNYGASTENFDVKAYTNSTLIQTKTVTLANKKSITVSFEWDSSSFALGKYAISAYVSPLIGETDTSDNAYANGVVQITLGGDANSDKKVDGKDIAIIAKAYNTRPENPLWDQRADLNGDFQVNGKDTALVSKNFGKTQ